MQEKTDFVGLRVEPGHKVKLKSIAASMGGASMSAAVRWCIEQAPAKPELGQQQNREAMSHGQ